MNEETQQTAFDLIPFADHEPVEQTTFDLVCFDGTVFTLPSNHPDITAGGIGGVSYGAILEDPSLMPLHLKQFAIADERNRPPVEPLGEPDTYGGGVEINEPSDWNKCSACGERNIWTASFPDDHDESTAVCVDCLITAVNIIQSRQKLAFA